MEKEEIFELSNPQKSIWVTEQYYKGSSINNICGTAIINESVDFPILEKAILEVLNNNEIFKIQFFIEEGNIKQRIGQEINSKISYFTVKNYEELDNIRKTVVSKPFNLSNTHLYNFYIFKMSNGQGAFMLNIHHLLADSWTLGFLSKKIVQIYTELKNGTYTGISSVYNYSQYIKNEIDYMNSERFKKDQIYWEDKFKTIPEVANINTIKDTIIDINSYKGNRQLCKIDKELLNLIKKYCKDTNISLYNFFMAIYAIYIAEISNLDDFVIGTPILNRTNFKEKNTSGMFVATQPFRVTLSGIDTFVELAQNIAKDTLNMLRHQKYPYQKLLENLRKRDVSVPNLYNILFSYQITNAQNEDELVSNATEWTFNGNCANNLDIQIFDINNSGSLDIAYDYKTNVFVEEEISQIHERILYIIQQVIENETISLNDIEVITPAEKEELIHTFNQTDLEYDENMPIIKYFEEEVKMHPNKIALISNNQKFTYLELNQKANSLAKFLIKSNVKSNDIIGIMLNRSPELIIGILAILKCGATYLPIDPEYPIDRISYMLENSETKIVLVNSITKEIINSNDIKTNTINIELNNVEIYSKEITSNLDLNLDNSSLAYLIYTSGSTGKPKGVKVTNRNLVNFVIGMKQIIDFNADKTLVSVTTMCFDIFGLELWCSLTSGITLVLANEQEQNNPLLLNKLCIENNVNIIQTTPSRFSVIFECNEKLTFLENITDILVGGETLNNKLLSQMKKNTNAKIYNMYGPTETTIWSTVKELTNMDTVTIGTPIANTQCYILNNHQKLLPVNIPGELYIGGDGVSDGYLKREDLNKEKFITTSFSLHKKIYNTNDLAYIKPDGEIIHLGRTDYQVKVHGYRIELEEIENIIEQEPIINKCVVTKKQLKNNHEALIAYYTLNENTNIEQLNLKLKTILGKKLPQYMIPQHFVNIDKMPYTANGKIDRKALGTYKINTTTLDSNISKPRNEIETIITETIKKKLNVQEFGIDNNIFDYGADSLTTISIITELFKYNFNLKVSDLYKYPTVRELFDNLLCKTAKHSALDYTHLDELNSIVAKFTKDTETNKINKKFNILLTGATGFLGSHILAEFLDNPKQIGKIYCIMRQKNNIASRDRLLNKIHFYFNDDYNKLFEKYVEVVECDITKKLFGLDENTYKDLQSKVNIAIHAAANVNHYGKYSSFEKINVIGTQNVIDFCKDNNIHLHHISTMTVSGNYLLEQDNKTHNFNENNFYIGQNFEHNVYSKSKLIAESLVIEAISKGQDATIYRIGDLTGRYRDGVFQENIDQNAVYLRLKSIVEIGSISKTILNNDLEFSPVDCTAKAVKTIICSSNNSNRIFNVYNPYMISTKNLLKFMHNSDYLITILEKEDFSKLIENLSMTQENQQKLLGIINDFTEDRDLVYNYTIKQNNDITCKYLKNLDFTWPVIDDKYLTKVLNYMKKVNFIK